MTAKHFRIIADGIRKAVELNTSAADHEDVDVNVNIANGISLTVRMIANKCIENNANFKPDKFYKACGLNSEGMPK